MLGWDIVEGEQAFTVLDQALDRLVVLHAIGFDEVIEGGLRVSLGLGHPDILQMTLGFGLQGLWRLVQHVGGLVNPEPPRDCRRLQLLRGWSYAKETIGKIFT